MATGAGRYDEHLTRVRELTGARAAVLLILAGNRGSGFDAQGTPEALAELPGVLRAIADEIERDIASGAPS